jgi:signal transduction histidine kinase
VASDVAAEATRLQRLVEDVLVLSRVERGTELDRHEPVLVHHVIRRVVADESSRWPSLVVDVEVEPDLPIASGDETYLEQVLRNLISNAAKYGRDHATVRAAAVDAGVELEVADDGPGVDREDRAHLFELFYRSRHVSTVPGAGIGLFVCRALVEAMGGTLTVGDAQPGGASFRVRLLRYEPA